MPIKAITKPDDAGFYPVHPVHVHEKSSFRHAFRQQRSIVPASGYYEWSHAGKSKQPWYITLQDDAFMGIAGLWECWQAPDGGRLETLCILVTEANSQLATIHERMPVILQPADFDLWLDRTVTDRQYLQELYQPYPAELMQERPVSTFVNSPAHTSEECIHRI